MTTPDTSEPVMIAQALNGLLAVELGSRVATGACGSLLAQAGARVLLAEYPDAPDDWKWSNRAAFAAGKDSLVVPDTGDTTLARAIAAADILICSSDTDPGWAAFAQAHLRPDAVICDITAFGPGAAPDGPPATDADIQALAGIAHTTGPADGGPVVLRIPVIEFSAGVYAAGAVVSILHAMRAGGAVQRIDISLYDCGVNALTTFLPAHFGGGTPGRLGNGHAMAVPWNAYRAADGWLMICTAKDEQWQRMCAAFDTPALAEAPDYALLADRVARRAEVDALVSERTQAYAVDDLVALMTRSDLANGLILPAHAPESEPNLMHRHMVRTETDPVSHRPVKIAGSVLRTGSGAGVSGPIPARDSARDASFRPGRAIVPARPGAPQLPFAGLKVVEIGQYTTAPLVGRHLGALGAEVIKVEPPRGDAARAWPPVRDGISLFFFMSNCGKDSIEVDLKTAEGRALFVSLIREADVFVENLKPGSMERLGLGAAELERINPALVYCQITGFGMDSYHGQKPAFDTVVQAASGMMDANAHDGTPLKAGISAGDFMGGQAALYAVIAALWQRGATGRGQYIDMSMQDVAAWMTSLFWNEGARSAAPAATACTDGHAVVTRGTLPCSIEAAATQSRAELVAACATAGAVAVPVRTVAEVVDCPRTVAGGLIQHVANAAGQTWPALTSPMRLSLTPPVIGRAIGLPRTVVTS